VLKLLKNTRNVHIVKILGSYVYKQTYNILFPLADMDLEDLLSGRKTTIFVHLDEVMEELRGLSSALNDLHSYRSGELGLSLVGCHHDLKPNNILVFGRSLALADFGLSRLALPAEGSQSVFKDCIGDYFGPECMDSPTLQPLKIGRPSDIWAFGCLVSEILTFFEHGPDEVARFRSLRATYVRPRHKAPWFHADGKLKPEVGRWLDHLESRTRSEDAAALLRLTRSMLSSDPSQRPDARRVELELTRLTLRALSKRVLHGWGAFLKLNPDISYALEKNRFDEWARFLGTSSLDGIFKVDAWAGRWTEHRSHMLEMCDLMQTARFEESHIDEDAVEDVHIALRNHVNCLWEAVPLALRKEMHIRLHHRNLESESAMMVQSTSALNDCSDPETASLAKMRRLVALMGQCKSDSDRRTELTPALDSIDIKVTGKLGEHSLGVYQTTDASELLLSSSSAAARPNDASAPNVLIEWWKVEDWDTDNLDEMFVRVGAIAALPNVPDRPPELCVLSSRGYFYDRAQARFGVVYTPPSRPAPPSAGSAGWTGTESGRWPCWPPLTLTMAMQRYASVSSGLRPPLGHRFALALALCVCLAEVHGVGWLHHDLCADNVVFFYSSSPALPSPSPLEHQQSHPARLSIEEPYIIGFNHSRPDQEDNVSLQPRSKARLVYRHPAYGSNGNNGLVRDEPATKETRFCKIFDYYSLGVVLLEIGLWCSVEHLISQSLEKPALHGLNSRAGDERRSALLRQAQTLGAYMGEIYRDAVIYCLSVDPTSGDPDSSPDGTDGFLRSVISPLSACKV
jgi:hypothetical protein